MAVGLSDDDCHETSDWKVPWKPLQSILGLCLLWHHPLFLAKDLKTQLQNLADWMWLGQNEEVSSIQVPSALVVMGLRRLEAIHIIPFPFSIWIHDIFKCQSISCDLSGAMAQPWSFHSLLFHGKLTLRLCFHFLQIPCDSKHLPPW